MVLPSDFCFLYVTDDSRCVDGERILDTLCIADGLADKLKGVVEEWKKYLAVDGSYTSSFFGGQLYIGFQGDRAVVVAVHNDFGVWTVDEEGHRHDVRAVGRQADLAFSEITEIVIGGSFDLPYVTLEQA